MFWLIVLLATFAGLHIGILLPTQIAIAGAAIFTVGLWIIWKLKWIILGIIGLEAFFGGEGGGT